MISSGDCRNDTGVIHSLFDHSPEALEISQFLFVLQYWRHNMAAVVPSQVSMTSGEKKLEENQFHEQILNQQKGGAHEQRLPSRLIASLCQWEKTIEGSNASFFSLD